MLVSSGMDTLPEEPESTKGGPITRVYESKEVVRKKGSTLLPHISSRPISHDFSLSSLEVVLFTFRVVFSRSPSRSLRMSVLLERLPERKYPLIVLILSVKSPPVSE
jgi:hypothetical protein